jgi:gamma-glutamylcyclotransferase (GGCT)/AIG2-like uncharacterized protein YtfP
MGSEKDASGQEDPHLADEPDTQEQGPSQDGADVEPRVIFVYGTLMAEELVSWLLTDSSANHKDILALRQPAVLKHYRRVPVKHSDYLALIPGSASDQVDGFLITPASPSQWKKMDDFEGEVYSRRCVRVQLEGAQDEVRMRQGTRPRLLKDLHANKTRQETRRLLLCSLLDKRARAQSSLCGERNSLNPMLDFSDFEVASIKRDWFQGWVPEALQQHSCQTQPW